MIILEIIFGLFLLGIIFWLGSHLYSTIFFVPYINSSDEAIRDALNLAGLKPGDAFLDLGCGRGDTLIVAARDFGAKAIGYEISLLPYFMAEIRTRRYSQINVYRSNFKKALPNLKKADIVYLYLLNSVNDRIEDWLFKNVKNNTKIVSLAFEFKKHKPVKTISTTNLERATKIFLYQK